MSFIQDFLNSNFSGLTYTSTKRIIMRINELLADLSHPQTLVRITHVVITGELELRTSFILRNYITK